MNFQEAERTYKDLRAQHASGKLNDAAFEAEVAKLRLQDAQGRWWQIGVQTGEWYVHDGQKWSKARPPVSAAPPPPSEPSSFPEGAAATGAGAAPAPAVKKPVTTGGGLPARMFSPAPAGAKNGSLPMPMLIGIGAAVLVVVLLIVLAVYFVFGGAGGGTAQKPTSTPTTSIATAPTTGIPTITPIIVATSTPLPPPTAVITTSTEITPTNTPRPVRTATRKPTGGTATPTGPAATKTPNVAPGLYVTKVTTDPAVVNFGDVVAFNVTFLNTTGTGQTINWVAKIYKCQDRGCTDDDLRKSIGQSTTVNTTLATGSSTVSTPKHWSVGVGACNYVARIFYLDQNNNPVEFNKTDGTQLYFNYTLCH